MTSDRYSPTRLLPHLLFLCLPFSASMDASKSGLTIGLVADQQDFHDGGCELALSSSHSDAIPSEKFIFLSDFNGRAVMNINSRDIRLALVRSTMSKEAEKVGDHSKFWYTAAGGISVEVDYTVTAVCPPADESCEVSHYNALLLVRSGSGAKTISAHGLCGT